MRLPGDYSRLLGVLALVLALALALVHSEETALEESSDAYLRNVVGELQLLNGLAATVPAPAPVPVEPLPAAPRPTAYRRDQEPRPRPRPRRPVARHDLVVAATEEELCRQLRAQGPSHLHQTETSMGNPLGLTTAELAAMYRKALESGAPLKYTSLVDGLQAGQSSRPPEPDDPQYTYYFYPLHSFRHELAPSHGYRTVPHFKYDSAPAEDSKKETSTANPLLVGISSFLGMALLFVLSMFFYPRFMHYMHLPFVTTSRTSFQNEFAHLATFVTEAIDHYNKRVRKKSRLSPSIIQMR